MTPLFRLALTAAALASSAPSRAADLPAVPVIPPFDGAGLPAAPPFGGGFRVARVPVRPVPLRYDVYGYPLLAVPPSPLAAGGCPAALQPDYDADGNLAGYAPLPMCR